MDKNKLKKIFSDEPEVLKAIEDGETIELEERIEEIDTKLETGLIDLRESIENIELHIPEKGDKGDKGDVGEKGDKGDKGETTIVEKVIEKRTQVVKEIPVITQIVKEVAVTDTPLVTAEKLNTLEEVLDVKVLKGHKDLLDKKTFDKFQNNVYTKGQVDQRWHGGGLTRVSHDTTLTGDGTPSSPLSVSPDAGAVDSVSNLDGTLTISPNTGDVLASLNLGNANTWTAQQDNTSFFRNNSDINYYGGGGSASDVIVAAAGQAGLSGWVGFKFSATTLDLNAQTEDGNLVPFRAQSITASSYSGAWTGDTIAQFYGGTGSTSYGASRIIYQDSGNTVFTSTAGFTFSGTNLLISNVAATAQSRIHINESGATAIETRYTNSATGATATDGFQTGITTAGVAEIRQRENLNLDLYTNNTLRLSLTGGGNFVYDTNVIYGDATNNTVGIGATRTGAISATNPRLRIFASGSTSATSSFEIMNAGSASRLMFRDDGRLWIGTGTASYNGLLTLDAGSGTQTEIQFTTNASGRTSTDGFYLQYTDAVGARYLMMENQPHVFYISGSEVARFSNTGAIMQITGTLAAQYSGAGSTRGGTISLISSAGTPQDWLMATAGNDNVTVNGRSWFLYDNTNSVARFFVDTNGNVGIGLGSNAAAARLHLISTSTPQIRFGQSTSIYCDASIAATTGVVTFDSVGGSTPSFVFSDAVSINGSLTLSAQNIITDTTTGMKVGTGTTQKLGFWNATPIVQPTTAVAAATFVANTSGIVNDTATFDGYTMGQIVKALRNAGLLA